MATGLELRTVVEALAANEELRPTLPLLAWADDEELPAEAEATLLRLRCLQAVLAGTPDADLEAQYHQRLAELAQPAPKGA